MGASMTQALIEAPQAPTPALPQGGREQGASGAPALPKGGKEQGASGGAAPWKP